MVSSKNFRSRASINFGFISEYTWASRPADRKSLVMTYEFTSHFFFSLSLFLTHSLCKFYFWRSFFIRIFDVKFYSFIQNFRTTSSKFPHWVILSFGLLIFVSERDFDLINESLHLRFLWFQMFDLSRDRSHNLFNNFEQLLRSLKSRVSSLSNIIKNY